MSELDLTPSGAPAPAIRRVMRHAAIEALLIMRNGEQFLLAIVIPAGLLLAGAFLGTRVGLTLDALAPGILALALWSTAFTSVAISTAFERRYGVLERLAATPLRRTGLLQGKAIAVTATAAVQLGLLVVMALILGWHPRASVLSFLPLVITALFAAVTFANLALACASVLRAEAVLGVANLVYLAGAALGLVTPIQLFPDGVDLTLMALPTAALGESFRAGLAGSIVWWPLLTCALWSLASSIFVRKVFRWTS